MSTLFELDTYQAIIKSQIHRDSLTRGAKARIAAVAGIQPAYLSQVLAGSSHLNLDQAANLADHWDFNDLETDYYLTLVSLARAGSQQLIKKLTKKLYALRSAATENPFTERPKGFDWEVASTYYSDALFSAIHLLLRIPRLQTVETLSLHLGLSKRELLAMLEQLAACGLVSRSLKGWVPVEKNLHAEAGSTFAKMHNRNWFLESASRARDEIDENLFYTSVHTLSEKDFREINTLLLAGIQKSRKIVEPSSDEVGAAMAIAWFKI